MPRCCGVLTLRPASPHRRPAFSVASQLCSSVVHRCGLLHRTAGDTERRYHLRYYKTGMCVHDTDNRGYCVKVGRSSYCTPANFCLFVCELELMTPLGPIIEIWPIATYYLLERAALRVRARRDRPARPGVRQSGAAGDVGWRGGQARAQQSGQGEVAAE